MYQSFGYRIFVTRDLGNYPYDNLTYIPRFIRKRKVTFSDGKLTCDSDRKSVWGFLCPHVIAAARYCNKTTNYDHRNVSCIWWKSYHKCKSLDSNDHLYGKKLYRLFSLLRAKEIIGINIEDEFIENVSICSVPYPPLFDIHHRFPKCDT